MKYIFTLLCIIATLPSLAQDQVSGKVTDFETGSPLIGVNVLIQGTTQGTITDIEGAYSLEIPDGAENLVFSFVGYNTETLTIGNRSTINIALVPDISTLGEIVVVGYGTQQKKDLVSAISTISPDEFENQPITRLDQVLQGRVPGVQVTNNSGAPGGDVKIRIRGANSLTGNNNPLYIVDGFIGADMRNINTHDIESIQVLKDASATAIYGSRGANGVVLITTKQGKSGKMKVDLSSRFTYSEVIKKLDMLTAAEYAEIINAKRAATGLSEQFNEEEIEAFRLDGGTDWQDEIFRPAMGQEYQLSISGGKEGTTYLVSGNFQDQEGIILNTDFKRYSIRTNINSHLSDKFSVRLNFMGTRREQASTSGASRSPVTQALAWAPITPLRDSTGAYTVSDPYGSINPNPLNLLYDQDFINESTVGNIVGGLNYEFIPGLTLDVNFGVRYDNTEGKYFTGSSVTGGVSNARRTSNETLNLQNTNTLTFKRILNKIHNVTFTAVYELQKYTNDGINAYARDLTYPSFRYNNLSYAGSFETGTDYAESSLMSLMGRVNYTLMDKYLLTASIRRDGSSKFQGDNKFSIFPSLAVGWRISEEGFMQDISFINNLKLRGSWGLTGNQAISPFGSLATYSSAKASFDNEGTQPGIAIDGAANTDLKWETTEQFDIGMDLGLLKGRLNLTADYFVKNTRDLLMYAPLPNYIGGNGVYRNIGKVENKGFELSLTAIPLRTADFEWVSSLNASSLKNKVVSLGGLADTVFVSGNVGAGLSVTEEFVYIPGQPMGAYFGINYLGTWKKEEAGLAQEYGAVPGDAKYEDINRDGAYSSDDFQVIGYGLPKYTLGWNNTISYKNFTLNVFLQGVLDFDKLNYARAASMTYAGDVRRPTLAEIKDRYIPGVNETSDIPGFSTSNKNYTQSTRFLEEGDFIRLKNVSLTYNIPEALTKQIGISIYAGATNLLTFTKYKGYDPESSSVGSNTDTRQSIDYGAYPNSRSYHAGITLSF